MDHAEADPDGGHLPVAAPTDAHGCTNVVGYANAFEALGYPTAVVCDNDDPKLVVADLAISIELAQTAAGLCIEEQVSRDLSPAGLRLFALHGISSVNHTRLNQKLVSRDCLPTDLQALLDDTADAHQLARLRTALGLTAEADGNEWFKTIDGGTQLARIVVAHGQADTVTHEIVQKLTVWCRGD